MAATDETTPTKKMMAVATNVLVGRRDVQPTAGAAVPVAREGGVVAPAASADVLRPSWLDRGRIPCLDGLRALSIALVYVEHVTISLYRGSAGKVTWLFGNIGGVGVDVFFAISGFLITLLLVREMDRTGTLSLRDFYTRRFLRLMPAAAAYIGIVFLLQLLGRVHLDGWSWFHVLTYTVNFDPHPTWETGHLWSLSIEEQFYFVWPFAILLIGPRRAGVVAALWLVGSPLLRFTLLRVYSHGYEHFENWTPLRVDCIAAGCLLAVVASDARFLRWTRVGASVAKVAIGVSVLGIVGGYVVGGYVSLFGITVGPTVRAACVVTLVWLSVNHRDSLWGRLLESGPLVAVGVLSYSLYLWQQLFLGRQREYTVLGVSAAVALAIVTALASYYLIERPFLRLKERAKK